MNEILLTLVVTLLGSTGVWGFLASRSGLRQQEADALSGARGELANTQNKLLEMLLEDNARMRTLLLQRERSRGE